MKKVGKKVIDVGIIGLGRSGRDIHGAQIMKVPDKFRIRATADVLPDRRRKAAAEWGCDVYSDWRRLLDRSDLDLIVVASPTHMHTPQSLAFLKAGFNVLCEKPLSARVSDVDKVIRAAKKARRVMAVFQCNRFNPVFGKVREVVKSGVLGRIVLIKSMTRNFKRRWDWQTVRSKQGGSLLNTGSHSLDQALQLFGTDVIPQVRCIMDRAQTYGDAEDHVKLMFWAKGHPTVDFEVSACCAYPGQDSFNVYGTRGGLRAGDHKVEWKYFDPRKQAKRRLVMDPLVDAQGNPAYCSDTIKWQEHSWEYPGGDSQFWHGVGAAYDSLYKTLAGGVRFPIALGEVRQQIAVIEECLRQNPPGKMPKADI